MTLNNGVYESWNPVRNNLTVSGITGVRFISSQDVVRVSDTKVTISLRFNGNNIDTDATLTFTVGAAAIEGYSGDALTATLLVTALPNRAPVFSGGASTILARWQRIPAQESTLAVRSRQRMRIMTP